MKKSIKIGIVSIIVVVLAVSSLFMFTNLFGEYEYTRSEGEISMGESLFLMDPYVKIGTLEWQTDGNMIYPAGCNENAMAHDYVNYETGDVLQKLVLHCYNGYYNVELTYNLNDPNPNLKAQVSKVIIHFPLYNPFEW